MKPMLASEPCEFKDMRFPLLASYKLDGIRCLITSDGPRTRSLKPVPNRHIAERLASLPIGLDGELVVLDNDGNVNFRATTSAVMSHDGEPDFQYWVFDNFAINDIFRSRWTKLAFMGPFPKGIVKIVGQTDVNSEQDVKDMFVTALTEKYEGLILRDPKAPYKHGRATTNSQWMMKMKPWADAEAEIIDVIEAYTNTNTKQTNELGRSFRSTDMEGLVAKGTLGSLVVQSSHWPKPFEIGTGWSADEAALLWERRAGLIGKMVRFSFVDTGSYDVPRHASYQGLRSEDDL